MFLRPWLLILLILIPLFYFAKKNAKINNLWKKFINPDFLPFLLVSNNQTNSKKNRFIFIPILWTLLVIALAGPCYEKLQTPTQKNLKSTILLVDLNSVNPTTLLQMKIKLAETLKKLKMEQVGLVLYDEKGYVALPLTEDLQIIEEMIPSLSPNVLPKIKNKPEEGFKKSIELLKNNAQTHGRILLFTGGIDDVSNAVNVIKKENYQVGILGFGKENQKTPILSYDGTFQKDINGKPILISPNKNELSKLGTYIEFTPDNQDIEYLLNATNKPLNNLFLNQETIFKVDEYRDLGIYILICLMPFIALFFRKGFIIILLASICPLNASASLFLRPDQELHINNQKAVESYNQQDYISALARFNQDSSDTGKYNQATSRAKLGQIDEAINLYNEVLKNNPNHQEAKFNKEYLERLKQQNKQERNDSDSNSSDNKESQDNSTDSSKEESDQNQNSESKTNSNDNKEENQNNTPQQPQNNSQENKGSNQPENNTENSQNQNEQMQEKNHSSKNDKDEDLNQNETQNTPNNATESSKEKSEESTNIEINESLDNSKNIDQNTQEIFNKLKKDPYQLLRYRLHEQYRRN